MNRVFPLYSQAEVERYQAHTEQQQACKGAVLEYLAHLNDVRETGRGVAIFGPLGVGKTDMACGMLNRIQREGYRVECIEMSTYIRLHHDRADLGTLVRAGSEEAVERWYGLDRHIRRILGDTARKDRVDWVLLDGVGQEYESASGWSTALLTEVVEFRCDRRLPTIFTSSLPLQEWAAKYGDHLASLLAKTMMIVVLSGENRYPEPSMEWKTDS